MQKSEKIFCDSPGTAVGVRLHDLVLGGHRVGGKDLLEDLVHGVADASAVLENGAGVEHEGFGTDTLVFGDLVHLVEGALHWGPFTWLKVLVGRERFWGEVRGERRSGRSRCCGR